MVPGLRDKLMELKSSKHPGIRQRAAATLEKLPEATQVVTSRPGGGRREKPFSELAIPYRLDVLFFLYYQSGT